MMLNLLRFNEQADYSKHPELEPAKAISGKEAYDLYLEHTLPHLHASGGSILFIGQGGPYLIGPSDVYWDVALLVRHKSLKTFMAFAQHEAYLRGLGHRDAALADSRLLPLSPYASPEFA